MRRQAVISEVLRSIGYDQGSSALEIEFTTDDVYRYSSVPNDVHAALMRAESHGTYFNRHVRDVYPYERLT